MALFESQPPRRKQQVSYEYVRLEAGKWWQGWLSGPVVTVHCHFDGKATRACRSVFTKGAVSCAWCDAGIEPIPRAYCPLWSDTGLRCVTIAADRYREFTERLEVGGPVRVTKTLSRGCAIRVERSKWTTGHAPVGESEKGPQDITPWLLRVWADDAIREWASAHPVSDNAVSQQTPTLTREEMEQLPEKDIRRHVANRLLRENGHPPLAVRNDDQQPADDPSTLDDTLASLSRKLPSLNGNHRKEKRKK